MNKKNFFGYLKQQIAFTLKTQMVFFFDVSKLSAETFDKIVKFLEFCKKNRKDFENREEEEKRAQENLYNHTVISSPI